jgi:alpha-1,2-mannosyltransferase
MRSLPTALPTAINTNKPFKGAAYCLLTFSIGLYASLFYLVLHPQINNIDFSSFYASVLALNQNHNPYVNLIANFLPHTPQLAANLNPPIFLLLLKPLASLNYQAALSIWIMISILAALLGMLIVLKIAFSPPFIKCYWAYLLSLGFLSYTMISNFVIAQVGALLFFFVMSGYLCYQHRHDTLAGMLWGLIVAIKFFPALLFFLVLSEKRYRVFSVMLVTVIMLSMLPWIIYGSEVYRAYFRMLPQVLWYGDSWNMSWYGFLFRCWIDPHGWIAHRIKPANLDIVNAVYGALLSLSLMGYWFLLNKKSKKPHQTMCLTITAMLLLSPLGWLYYGPLLLFPLAILWRTYSQQLLQNSSYFLMYCVSFFMINLPINYTTVVSMPSLLSKLGYYSLSFYGLLILTYLCIKIPTVDSTQQPSQHDTRQAAHPIFIIVLMVALWTTLNTFLILCFKN